MRFEDPIFASVVERVRACIDTLEMREARLWHKTEGVYVRQEERDRIMFEAHKAPTGGHFGFAKTLQKLRGRAWWPTIRKDVAAYVSLCGICQRCKTQPKIPADVEPLPVASAFERLHLDLMGQAFDRAHITCDGSTAVLLPSDRMALALATVLNNRGITLGRDLGLLGFDDTVAGRTAGLTTVRPPLEAMGGTAARRIMQAMTEGSRVVQETIAPILLPRTSTERP